MSHNVIECIFQGEKQTRLYMIFLCVLLLRNEVYVFQSDWPHVHIMLRRNLLYTAVTRAKAKVILIGQKQAVFVAIHKCDVGQRNTVLADRIVAYYNRELSRRVA